MPRIIPLHPAVIVRSMSPGNPEAPKAMQTRLDFAIDTRWDANLNNYMQQQKFQSLRTIYYDATACASNASIYFPASQQRMTLLAGKQGYRQVLVDPLMEIQVTGASPDVLILHLLNVDIPSRDWPAFDSTTPVAPAQIGPMNSPRLLGRATAGVGNAEQLTLTAPFFITGGTLFAQAAAQYNLLGRRTAGAGPMEDSTRQQLNIAKTDLANAFNGDQSYAIATGIYGLNYTNSDAGATGFFQQFNYLAPAAVGSYAYSFEGFVNNTTPAAVRIGAFSLQALGVTAGAENSQYSFSTRVAGAFASRISIGAGIYANAAAGGDPGVGNANMNGYFVGGTVAIDSAGRIRPRVSTVGALPSAVGVQGARAHVSDANAPAFGAIVAGGGAISTPVYADGAGNWRVG